MKAFEVKYSWKKCPGCGDTDNTTAVHGATTDFLFRDTKAPAKSWVLRGWKCSGKIFGTVWMINDKEITPDHGYVCLAKLPRRKVTVLA